MILTALLLAAVGPAVPIETDAQRFVVEQFERVGRANPVVDPALSKAARILAQAAMDGTAADALEVSYVTAVVSEAGATDPTPRAFVLRGSPRSEPLKALLEHKDLAEGGATHLGIGAVEDPAADRAALVLLFADRKADVQAFPHHFKKPVAGKPLCATLGPLLGSAEWYVTRPKGDVEHLATRREQDRWCATASFPTKGRHTVELLARGERGPEVAALFFVDIGDKPQAARRAVENEPQTPAEIRAAVLDRVNKLRAGFQVPPLAPDRALDAVAAAYAKRMADEGFFSHIAPDGSDIRGRLNAARYDYTTAGENLGLAAGPLAAHFGIEHSPGHRKNLMDPVYTTVGIGTAARADGLIVLVEVMAVPLAESSAGDPLEQAYDAIATARKAKGLKPLIRAENIEPLLAEQARAALGRDSPKLAVDGRSLHDRVFDLRDDLSSGSVEVIVADNPAQVSSSKLLSDPEAQVVGLGLTKGDSPTFGRGKYWVVVFYGTRR